MSLRHALIGLLAEQPASGWDLTRKVEETLGPIWPAGHPQIYSELRKLREDGLIEVDSEGPRRRTTYRPTAAGLDEVRRWLASPGIDHTCRMETVLRSVFFWLMTPAGLAAHLDREAAYYRELADHYRKVADARDRGDFGHSPQTQSMRVSVEAGIRVSEALGDWATWARSAALAEPPAATHEAEL